MIIFQFKKDYSNQKRQFIFQCRTGWEKSEVKRSLLVDFIMEVK